MRKDKKKPVSDSAKDAVEEPEKEYDESKESEEYEEDDEWIYETLGAIASLMESGGGLKPAKDGETCFADVEKYEKLASSEPEKYAADLADSYRHAGERCATIQEFERSADYFSKAAELYRTLTDGDEKYRPSFAQCLKKAAWYCEDPGQTWMGERYYPEAIREHEKLAVEDPGWYLQDLAGLMNYAAVFYRDHGQPEKAAGYFLDAIALYEKLVKALPGGYRSNLAENCLDYGILTGDRSYSDRAYELAKEAGRKYWARKIMDKYEETYCSDGDPN